MGKFLLGVLVTLICCSGVVLDATNRADGMAEEVIRLEIENKNLSRISMFCYGEER